MSTSHRLEVIATDATPSTVRITLDGVPLHATRLLLEMLPDKIITATITVIVAPEVSADVVERVFVDPAQEAQ